jgi:hypothetical protein
MAKSRKVTFNGEEIRISNIKGFAPKGRQMARTINRTFVKMEKV